MPTDFVMISGLLLDITRYFKGQLFGLAVVQWHNYAVPGEAYAPSTESGGHIFMLSCKPRWWPLLLFVFKTNQLE